VEEEERKGEREGGRVGEESRSGNSPAFSIFPLLFSVFTRQATREEEDREREREREKGGERLRYRSLPSSLLSWPFVPRCLRGSAPRRSR